MRVHKTNQSLQLLEDGRVRLNCSVASQTSLDSHYTVLWYARRARTEAEAPMAPAAPILDPGAGAGAGAGVAAVGDPDELLLKIDRSGAFEYGAYAEEERLRSRLQAERPSPRQHSLTLHRAETSDSATYYCLVEEWMTDPDGAWYRAAREASGFTHVLVKRPGKTWVGMGGGWRLEKEIRMNE